MLVDVAQPHEWCVHVAQGEAQLLVEIVAASCFYIVEQLIHPAGWQWIFIGVIILDLSQLGSLGYSIVQSAQAVDQLDVLGIRTEPNSSLRYLLHLVDRHLSAVSHTFAEKRVATVDVCLQVAQLFGSEWAGHQSSLIAAVAVGLHLVELDSQLLSDESAHVGEGSEDADASSQSGRLSHDVACAHAHIVCSRCCHSAHRNHHGFLLVELAHSSPYLFGGIGVAASRIDSDNYSLYVLVFGKVVQVGNHVAAHNLLFATPQTCCSLAGNASLAVVDGDGASVVFVLYGSIHLAHACLSDAFGVLDAKLFLHDVLYLVVIAETVHHLVRLQQFAVFEGHKAVGIMVERVFVDTTALGHVAKHLLPQSVDVARNLLAVGIAHLVFCILFGETLEFSHLHHRVLDAKLGVEVFQEHGLRSQSVPVDRSFRIDVQFVGHRGEVIASLRHGVAIGDDPLAALLEILECLAYFL